VDGGASDRKRRVIGEQIVDAAGDAFGVETRKIGGVRFLAGDKIPTALYLYTMGGVRSENSYELRATSYERLGQEKNISSPDSRGDLGLFPAHIFL
jgi:hypothetical protein